MPEYLACLVSVSHAPYHNGLVAKYQEWANENRLSLVVVVLDSLEAINAQAIEGMSPSAAFKAAKQRAAAVTSGIRQRNLTILPFDQAIERFNAGPFMSRFEDAFDEDREFRSHCLNETFSNLLPKFKRLGVHEKSNKRVWLSARYLIGELALKSGLAAATEVYGEIMPRAEGSLALAIYEGRYGPSPVKPVGFRIVVHDGDTCEVALVRGGGG